jgi:hypothetical protein
MSVSCDGYWSPAQSWRRRSREAMNTADLGAQVAEEARMALDVTPPGPANDALLVCLRSGGLVLPIASGDLAREAKMRGLANASALDVDDVAWLTPLVVSNRFGAKHASGMSLLQVDVERSSDAAILTSRFMPASAIINRRSRLFVAMIGGFVSALAAFEISTLLDETVYGAKALLLMLSAMVGGLLGASVRVPSEEILWLAKRRSVGLPSAADVAGCSLVACALLLCGTAMTLLLSGATLGTAVACALFMAWHGGLDYVAWNLFARALSRGWLVYSVGVSAVLVPASENASRLRDG